MPSETPLTTFGDVLVLLAEAGVKFLTVGGVAVSLNGYVRSTLDVDILVERSPENLDKLIRALSTFGQGYARELTVEDFTGEEGSVRVSESFDIDIFVQMRGYHYEQFANEALVAVYKGQKIPFLNPRQLILLKRESYREKDQLDVLALTNLLGEKAEGTSKATGFLSRLGRWLGLRSR